MAAENGSQALKTALEDPETADFMRVIFSLPEQRPDIICCRWRSQSDSGSRWAVLIGERSRLVFPEKDGLMNVALVEVDVLSRTVLRREFLRSLLDQEVEEALNLWLRRGGYTVRRIRPQLRRIAR